MTGTCYRFYRSCCDHMAVRLSRNTCQSKRSWMRESLNRRSRLKHLPCLKTTSASQTQKTGILETQKTRQARIRVVLVLVGVLLNPGWWMVRWSFHLMVGGVGWLLLPRSWPTWLPMGAVSPLASSSLSSWRFLKSQRARPLGLDRCSSRCRSSVDHLQACLWAGMDVGGRPWSVVSWPQLDALQAHSSTASMHSALLLDSCLVLVCPWFSSLQFLLLHSTLREGGLWQLVSA